MRKNLLKSWNLILGFTYIKVSAKFKKVTVFWDMMSCTPRNVLFSPSSLPTLNMEAADSSETLIAFYEDTRYHNPESSESL
jgi:hypothetical protein